LRGIEKARFMEDNITLENKSNTENFEDIKMKVKNIMSSKFGIVTEEVVLPKTLSTIPKAEEIPADVMFREEVKQILPNILSEKENVLIFQNIATQHALATIPVFIEAGLDTYFTFILANKSIRPSIFQDSYCHPNRVMSVALANEERIKEAQEKLTREKLRGIVINFDPHADFEDKNGDFDRFLPTEEKLKELGIKRIILLGEFPPEKAKGLTDRRINRKEEGDKSHIYDYLRQMKNKGYTVSLIGIDRRHTSEAKS
jgi:hypothetical protein